MIVGAFMASRNFRSNLNENISNKIVPFQLICILRKICENMLRLTEDDKMFLPLEDRDILT